MKVVFAFRKITKLCTFGRTKAATHPRLMSERVLARPPSLVSRYRRTASLPEEYRFSASIKLLISLNKVEKIVMNVVFAI